MIHLAPLLAAFDIGDLIWFATILFVFVVPVISQLVAKIRKMQPPQAGGPQPARPVPRDVTDEIEEFMRRVTKRPGERPVGPRKPQPPVEEPVRAEVVGHRPVVGQVGQYVKKDLPEEGLRRRDNQLGSEVAHMDDKIEQHLHQAFDHEMGQLDKAAHEAMTPSAPAESSEPTADSPEVPATSAVGLLDLIANPDSLCQAIILSEIFQRPEERWR